MVMTGRIRSSLPLFNRLFRADSLSAHTHRSALHGTLLHPELSKNYSAASPKIEEKIMVPLALFGGSGNYASALYLAAVKGNALDKVESELLDVVEASKNSQLFLNSPRTCQYLQRQESKPLMIYVAKLNFQILQRTSWV